MFPSLSGGRTRLNLYFADGNWDFYINLEPARALLLADLLRNEKPIYWNDGMGILFTGSEPVGEEEGL